MKAAVLEATQRWPEVAAVQRPEPRAGELLIRVHATGLCGTDLKLIAGLVPLKLPLILGHEIAGEVVASHDDNHPVGQLVACHPYVVCGGCRFCGSGRPMLCPTVQLYGYNRPGGLAEYVAVSASGVIPFDDRIEPAVAAVTMDAVSTCWHALRSRAKIMAAEHVLVVGAGGLGMNAVQVAIDMGARVAVIEPNPARRKAVMGFGAICAVAPDDMESLTEQTATGFDVAIEVSGTERGFQSAVQLIRPGGRIVVCGYRPGQPASIDSMDLIGREVQILGSRSSSKHEAAEALDAVAAGRLQPVLGARFALDDIGDAFDLLNADSAIGRVVIEV